MPRAALGEKLLVGAVLVLFNDCHRGVEDVLFRAVVLFKQDGLCVGVILLKTADVAIIRATPAIDRVMNDDPACKIIVKIIHF